MKTKEQIEMRIIQVENEIEHSQNTINQYCGRLTLDQIKSHMQSIDYGLAEKSYLEWVLED